MMQVPEDLHSEATIGALSTAIHAQGRKPFPLPGVSAVVVEEISHKSDRRGRCRNPWKLREARPFIFVEVIVHCCRATIAFHVALGCRLVSNTARTGSEKKRCGQGGCRNNPASPARRGSHALISPPRALGRVLTTGYPHTPGRGGTVHHRRGTTNRVKAQYFGGA
jgi:hypothetical protein